jgi:hypothetical protein
MPGTAICWGMETKMAGLSPDATTARLQPENRVGTVDETVP